MGFLDLSVSGVSPLLSALATFQVQVQGGIQAALEEAGEHAYEIADVLVPVDTGYLQSRTTVEKEIGEVRLENDTPYCLYVELGTYKMAAQPFLVPALIETSDWLMDEGFKVHLDLPFGRP